ncbi:MAG: hypothetical protein S4CHLAM7_01950 [Chlamydiae bacterium]|nr:hypothetical protein [Chlamydiota bacterium]
MNSIGKHVLIVGGGLSGISAALEVEKLGGKVTLFEADSSLGGRVKTDEYEGFKLDKGFQVLLTSYPAVRQLSVLKSLELGKFQSGAMCYLRYEWLGIYNPLKHPFKFIKSLFFLPSRFLLDLLKLSKPFFSFKKAQGTTVDVIKKLKLSDSFIRLFIQPFFGGVFLERKLKTRASLFQKYLRFFSRGRAGLPINGMQQLAYELQKKMEFSEIHTDAFVTKISKRQVTLSDGRTFKGDAVIVALSNPALCDLVPEIKKIKSLSVTCLYFSIEGGLLDPEPILYLGEEGPVNNFCFPNRVQASYAPEGKDLLSVTVVDPKWQGHPNLENHVKAQIANKFNISEFELTFLKAYHIAHALPSQRGAPHHAKNISKNLNGVFLAGEEVNFASINGALRSGQRAARAAMQEFS